jgi:hypothetical protein
MLSEAKNPGAASNFPVNQQLFCAHVLVSGAVPERMVRRRSRKQDVFKECPIRPFAQKPNHGREAGLQKRPR